LKRIIATKNLSALPKERRGGREQKERIFRLAPSFEEKIVRLGLIDKPGVRMARI
jgi:hypothetical protein